MNDQPKSIREASAVLLKYSQTSEKLANAAIRWALAEKYRRECKRRFSATLRALTNWEESHEDGPPKMEVVFCGRWYERPHDPKNLGKWVADWVFNEFSTLGKTGESANSHPLVIAQDAAWIAYREAKKQAGIARGALTRMALRAAT